MKMNVRIIESRIPKKEAVERLKPKRRFLLNQKKAFRKIEFLYLPYFWVRLQTLFKGKRDELLIAIDAIDGTAVFPDENFIRFKELELSDPLPFLLQEERIKPLALDTAHDFSMQVGLRQKVPLETMGFLSIERVYYPFWIAYFSSPKGLTFTALDAVSGMRQGVKMKQVFIKALRILENSNAE